MLSERRKRDTDSEGNDGDLPRFPLCQSRRAKLTIRAKKESEIVSISEPSKLPTASIEISTRLTKTKLTLGLVVGKIYEGRHWRSPVYGITDWLTKEEMSHANLRIAPRTAPLDPVTFALPDALQGFFDDLEMFRSTTLTFKACIQTISGRLPSADLLPLDVRRATYIPALFHLHARPEPQPRS